MQIKIDKKIFLLPRLSLTRRQISDLTLITSGAFAPLKGFMDEKTYTSVIENMRLSDKYLWPIPIVLDIENPSLYPLGSTILLCDAYGNPHATIEVSSVFKPDKKTEARLVYNTTHESHFGVDYLFHKTHDWYIGGNINSLFHTRQDLFAKYYHTPKELREWFKKNNWATIIAFQTRNPIHRAHLEIIKQASKSINGKILIHPAVGETKDGDIDVETRIKCYIHVYNNYAKNISKLSLLPLAMRMAGPREALLHAIIRKNYGCTHFIVGRDHAGPGRDDNGIPFYGQYDAQILTKKLEKEIGITIIDTKEVVFDLKKKKYIFSNSTTTNKDVVSISGTRLREMLRNNIPIPDWFSFPEVIKELRLSISKKKKSGFTVFFTGLPSSGKSTIANLLYNKLLKGQKRKITLLDGDIVRMHLSKGLSFSKEDRIENIKRIGFVAKEVVKHGGIAICAAIAPYEQSRKWNRQNISEYGYYIEVFVATPLSVCKRRDTKGLYEKTKKGLIANFTGVNDPYEIPKNPEIIVKAHKQTPEQSVKQIMQYLKLQRLI